MGWWGGIIERHSFFDFLNIIVLLAFYLVSMRSWVQHELRRLWAL